MSIETVRVSKEGKDLLVVLKRRTGVTTWNVLCRWALCTSLAEDTRPRNVRQSAEGGIEIAWKTFAGEYDEIYLALLADRCRRDGKAPTPEAVSETLRLHLHRGIGYLAGDPRVRSIAGLVMMAANCGGAERGAGDRL